MKYSATAILLIVLLNSCLKSSKQEDDLFVICPPSKTLSWLIDKEAEYSSCSCLTGFRQGIYQNQPIIEIYNSDPVCNALNTVYNVNGEPWFTSADEGQYADYMANVREQLVIWTCEKDPG